MGNPNQTENTIVRNKPGRKPRQLVNITVGKLASLNSQPTILPLATVGSLILLDNTTEVAKTREELMAELKKLPQGTSMSEVSTVKRAGSPITYGQIMVGENINPELDPNGIVSIDLHRFVKASTEQFQASLELVLKELAKTAEVTAE